jgi:hypothetical protein
VIGYEERGCEKLRMTKSKKNENKAKLNLTVREQQRNKLEQMASLENRSVSNLIEVMADERWKRLAEQQGIAKFPGKSQTFSTPSASKAFQRHRCGLISITVIGHRHEWMRDKTSRLRPDVQVQQTR